MIQAMVWAFVLTSGAGMSRSGPMSTLISVAKRRGSRSPPFWATILGRASTPPKAGVGVQLVRGEVELLLRHFPGVDRRGDLLGSHRGRVPPCRERRAPGTVWGGQARGVRSAASLQPEAQPRRSTTAP